MITETAAAAPVNFDVTPGTRRVLLVNEARRWVGIGERGGNNRGQLVEIFQRHAGIAPGDPWCMAFVQYCLAQIDNLAALFNPATRSARIGNSCHCMTVWGSTDPDLRDMKPSVGSIAIWRRENTAQGHTGIVSAVSKDEFRTIEGNTSPAKGVDREGDGVFEKTHQLHARSGTMILQGFISPWGKT